MSKARDLASLLGGGGTGVPSFSGTGAIDVPAGTTLQRPANPNTGYVRFNTTNDQLEQYTDGSGWQGISPPPTITSTDVSEVETSDATQTIVITGQNFDAAATGTLIDANGVTVSPTTSTRNSSNQITITFTGDDRLDENTAEPLDVKVTNGSGLSAVLEDAISVDDPPTWSTSSGNLGTVIEDVAMATIQLSATDPEGGPVSYAISSGALPTGLSLSSSGAITGTPNANGTYSSSGVTHNFSVSASDSDSNTTTRSFNILRKWPDGTSSSAPAVSGLAILGFGLPSGNYWIQPNSSQSAYVMYVDNTTNGGGWVRVAHASRTNGSGYAQQNSAYQMDNNNPPGSDSYSRHPGSAWMEALRDASTYAGNSPYWMHAYAGEFTGHKWIHSDMDNNINLETAVESSGDPRGRFSWSYQGTFYYDHGNFGSVGMGGSHYNNVGGKNNWVWCRHPEQGDGGFNGDGLGRADGFLYIK